MSRQVDDKLWIILSYDGNEFVVEGTPKDLEMELDPVPQEGQQLTYNGDPFEVVKKIGPDEPYGWITLLAMFVPMPLEKVQPA